MSEMKKPYFSLKVREALNLGNAVEKDQETKNKGDIQMKEQPKKDKQIETISTSVIDSSAGSLGASELYDELFMEDQSNPFEEEENRLNQVLDEFKKYEKDGTVLMGEVFGVEPLQDTKQILIAVLYNGIKITIPDFEFFEPTFDFNEVAPRYFAMSEKDKRKVREKVAKYHIGAKIYFCIKRAVKHKVENPDYDGEAELIVIASRKEAMEKRRDLFFTHIKNRNSPYNVKVGSTIKRACVLAVSEKRVTLECCGVETRVDNYDLCDDDVQNCHDYVSPGDTIPVRIKKIHINPDSVYLKVTGKILDTAKAVKSTVPKGTYLGVVERFNKDRGLYTVKINNGIDVKVPVDYVIGNKDIFVGDKVQILIIKLENNFALGKARKI